MGVFEVELDFERMCAKFKIIRYKEIFWYDESAFYLPRQDMNKSENPDESSLFGMLSLEFTTILLP